MVGQHGFMAAATCDLNPVSASFKEGASLEFLMSWSGSRQLLPDRSFDGVGSLKRRYWIKSRGGSAEGIGCLHLFQLKFN